MGCLVNNNNNNQQQQPQQQQPQQQQPTTNNQQPTNNNNNHNHNHNHNHNYNRWIFVLYEQIRHIVLGVFFVLVIVVIQDNSKSVKIARSKLLREKGEQ